MILPIDRPLPVPFAGMFGFHPDPRSWVKDMGEDVEWRVYFHAKDKRATITEIELAMPDAGITDPPITALQLAGVIEMYRDWEDRLEEVLMEYLEAVGAFNFRPA